MKLALSVDISCAVKMTRTLTSQMMFAFAHALTLTAIQAQTDVVAAMTQVFDAPTPFALNSTYVKPATKDRLESFVMLKDWNIAGIAPVKFLAAEVYGGNRNEKRSERALEAARILPSGSFVVPGAGVKLDQYGNISAGTMQKILSAVHAQGDQYANTTTKSRRRAIAAGRKLDYFAGKSPISDAVGVWERDDRGLHPILIFIDKKPSYRVRLNFYAIARETYDRVYKRLLNDALVDAIATARL